jgi:hypothetical protein
VTKKKRLSRHKKDCHDKKDVTTRKNVMTEQKLARQKIIITDQSITEEDTKRASFSSWMVSLPFLIHPCHRVG